MPHRAIENANAHDGNAAKQCHPAAGSDTCFPLCAHPRDHVLGLYRQRMKAGHVSIFMILHVDYRLNCAIASFPGQYQMLRVTLRTPSPRCSSPTACPLLSGAPQLSCKRQVYNDDTARGREAVPRDTPMQHARDGQYKGGDSGRASGDRRCGRPVGADSWFMSSATRTAAPRVGA